MLPFDEPTPPLTGADVMTRRVEPAPRRRRPLLAAGGAALALAAVVAGFVVLVGDGGRDRVDSADQQPDPATTRPGPTTVTPGPGGPAPGVLPLPAEGQEQPSLLVWDNNEMALIDYSGKELARGPQGDWYTNRPDVGVDLVGTDGGVKPVDAVAIDDPIPGCQAVHGRGGILAAACGGLIEGEASEIRLVAGDGTSRKLSGPHNPSHPDVGHWRYALPSPDGRRVLAQWSGECEVPLAVVIDVGTGRVDDVAPAGTNSYAIGWAPDGRAIVGIGAGPCSNEDFTGTGTFLVDPARQVRTRIHPFFAGAPVRWGAHPNTFNRLERRVERALEEIGIEGCCGEPSYGKETNSAGMVFEGVDIEIIAVPSTNAAELDPMQPSKLRFRCAGDTYTLGEFDSNRSSDRALLERAAAKLVSRLYCARRPA